MSNLVAANPNLPAYLQQLAANTELNKSAASGISSGGWPRISIKGGKFRLQNPSQNEVVVPQFFLDVIIVDANPHGISKVYYNTKWDPNSEGQEPACYSDNGVGPSINAKTPQCSTCAACPHNTWGSKISEASGKQIKACSDKKKLAVFIAANTNGPVFELDIPGDSLSNFVAHVRALDKHGIPLSSIITRVSFDTTVSHPKLIFQPAFSESGQLPYINADQAEDVMSVIGTDEVDNCTGKNDRAIDGAKTLPVSISAPATPAYTPPALPPRQMPPVAASHAAPQSETAVAAAPAGPPSSFAPAIGVAEAPKRTRRTSKTVNTVDSLHPPTMPPVRIVTGPHLEQQAAPTIPASAAQLAAPLAPAGVTNSALDDLIAQAMKA